MTSPTSQTVYTQSSGSTSTKPFLTYFATRAPTPNDVNNWQVGQRWIDNSNSLSAVVTGATQSNPCIITSLNGFSIGQLVTFSNVGGMTQLNGNTYLITSANGTTFTIAVDSTSFTAYSSGGTAKVIADREYILNGFSSSQGIVTANWTLLNSTPSGGAGSGAVDTITVDVSTAPGSNPVPADASGNITITGNQVASGIIGANVIRTDSLAANTFTIEIQRSAAVAATDSTKNGVAHFNSAEFTVDSNGFVGLVGGGSAIEKVNVQTGTTPIVPSSGAITINGATVAAGTNPVRTDGTGANTMALEVQISQAIAGTDATKIGLSNFDSASFAVDANGFVTASGTGLGKTITGDSGGALAPTGGNWNIFGRSGSKTSGAASTLTIKSPPYADQGGSTTVTLNSGSFATAAITLTLPASVGLADGDLFEFVCTTAGALVIQAVGTQKIRIGTLLSSAAGTATSTSIGDSVSLRFRATDGFFYATSSIGTWLIA